MVSPFNLTFARPGLFGREPLCVSGRAMIGRGGTRRTCIGLVLPSGGTTYTSISSCHLDGGLTPSSAAAVAVEGAGVCLTSCVVLAAASAVSDLGLPATRRKGATKPSRTSPPPRIGMIGPPGSSRLVKSRAKPTRMERGATNPPRRWGLAGCCTGCTELARFSAAAGPEWRHPR